MTVGAMPEPPELKRWKLDRISCAGTHAMGLKTYQEMSSFWPQSKDPYAAPMNDIPKVVFSKTLMVADWPETTIASGDLASEVSSSRRKRGGEIIAWGRGRLRAIPRSGKPHRRIRHHHQAGRLRQRKAFVPRLARGVGVGLAGNDELRERPHTPAVCAEGASQCLILQLRASLGIQGFPTGGAP
jgi:hypothetical protein